MKCTSQTRAVLRMKRHIDDVARETGLYSILAKKDVIEEIMDTMRTRRDLSEKGYSILRKHIVKQIDSKVFAESGITACA